MMATAPLPRAIDQDRRVRTPIVTPRALAALEGMSTATVSVWSARDVITTSRQRRGWPSIPLLGLAEGHLAWELRKHKLRMEEVQAVLNLIRHNGGSEFATLSNRLVTDGVYAYLRGADSLSRVVDRQVAIDEVVNSFLVRLIPDEAGFVARYQVAQLPDLVIDPEYNAGRPTFVDGMVPLFAVQGLLEAGASADEVADEYRLAPELVESVERADPAWLSTVA